MKKHNSIEYDLIGMIDLDDINEIDYFIKYHIRCQTMFHDDIESVQILFDDLFINEYYEKT